MIELKKDFWLMPLSAIFAFIFAAGLHESMLWFLFNVCSLCILITLIYRWRNWFGLEIDRVLDKNQILMEAGTDLKILLNIRALGILPWPWLEIKDVLPAILTYSVDNTPSNSIIWVKRGTPYQSEYTISNICRGVHVWDTIEYKSGDIFGFISFKGSIVKPIRLIVHPKTVNLSLSAFSHRRIQGSVTMGKKFQRDREQPVSVRDYQPGDGLSYIAWKSTAKRGKLQSKEFEPLINDSFHVVLDCTASNWKKGYDPSFEEGVIVAASLVKSAVISQIPVTFYSNTNRIQRQINIDSRNSYHSFLTQMAFIDTDGNDDIITVLGKSVFPHRSNIVLISSYQNSDLEKNLGRQAIKKSINTLILINKNYTLGRYVDDTETGFCKKIIINNAEELTGRISRR